MGYPATKSCSNLGPSMRFTDFELDPGTGSFFGNVSQAAEC